MEFPRKTVSLLIMIILIYSTVWSLLLFSEMDVIATAADAADDREPGLIDDRKKADDARDTSLVVSILLVITTVLYIHYERVYVLGKLSFNNYTMILTPVLWGLLAVITTICWFIDLPVEADIDANDSVVPIGVLSSVALFLFSIYYIYEIKRNIRLKNIKTYEDMTK